MTAMLKIIEEIYGKEVADIIKYIMEKKEVSIDELVKKFDLEPAEIRKILYALENLNIIKRRRIKNGLYLHYDFKWSVNTSMLEKIQRKIAVQHLQELKRKVQELPDIIYECPICGVKVPFEEAFEYGFRCPECGEMLVQKENEEKRRLIEKIKRLEEELGIRS